MSARKCNLPLLRGRIANRSKAVVCAKSGEGGAIVELFYFMRLAIENLAESSSILRFKVLRWCCSFDILDFVT
jgi:hypothetical protein